MLKLCQSKSVKESKNSVNQSVNKSVPVCQSKCSTLSFDSQSALKQGMPARTHTTLFEEESDHMVLVLRGCPRAAHPSVHTCRERVCVGERTGSLCLCLCLRSSL